jgi:hypothetical protein
MVDVEGMDPPPVGVDGASGRHEALRANNPGGKLRGTRCGRRVEDVDVDRVELQQ